MYRELAARFRAWGRDKDTLTLWMNNLTVLYAFFLPVSGTVKSKVFVLILLLFVWRGNVVHYIKEAFSNPVVRAFLYFFLLYVIWLVGTEHWADAAEMIRRNKYALYLPLFFVIVDGRYVDRIIGGFIAGMLLSEVLSYSMLFGLIPWEFNLWGMELYRAYAVGDPSPFLHHIHYGVLLSLTVVLLFQQIVVGKERLPVKIMMGIFVLTASVNVFVTGGRTGYVTYIVMLGFLLAVLSKRWALLFLLIVGMTFTLAYRFSPMLQEKVDETAASLEKLTQQQTDYRSSLGQRVGFWYYAAKVIEEHPLLGVGTGDSLQAVFAKVPPEHESIKRIAHEHNQYISVLLQFGLVGFLVFMNVYWQIWRYRPDEWDLRIVMLAATVAISVGIMTTIFNLRVLLPLWAVMLAVTMKGRAARTIEAEHLPPERKIVTQILLAGAALYLYAMVNKYWL
jgi:O-antigen ligase